MRTLWTKVRAFWNRSAVKRDIDEELRFHLEQRTAENLAAGMGPEEAAREARKRFGNWQSVREECRDSRWASVGDGLARDVRYGCRQLFKTPGFTAVAVLSLAVGIGANTAVFCALNALLLRSLPVRDPQELRLINWTGLNAELNSYTGTGIGGARGGFQMGTSFPYPAYRDFRDKGTGFTDVFAFFPVGKGVTAVARGEASIAGTLLVSGNFFRGYGASAFLGRSILPADDEPGAAPVAVITYGWWERHFGLDPGVLGQSVTLNKTSFTIVGVLQRHYAGPLVGDPTDIYVPMSAQPQLVPSRPLDSPNRWWVQVMGRLAPGANEGQAQASLAVLFRQTLSASNSKMDQPGITLQDGSRGPLMLRQRMAKPFLALTAVTGLVLLIACANLAGLLLARGAARRHEMAVRAAIGAGRWRLIRQGLTESLVLSLMGGGLGLAVAVWGKQLLLALAPDSLRFDLRTDSNVLAFTLGVSALTALVFGVLPALRASRVDPLEGLKSQTALGVSRLRLGKALVVAQVSFTVMLAVGAGLMVRSFTNLKRLDPGFDPENILLFRIDPGQAGYGGERLTAFYDRTRAAIAAIPGVRSVAFSDFALASDSYSSEGIELPGRERRPGEDWNVAVLSVSEDFFRTLSIPLLLGRDFSGADTATAPAVAVVNETLARRLFPGEQPIGQTLRLQDGTGRAFQVVGVCGDAKYDQMRTVVPPVMYLSQRQRTQGGVCFEVRSALPPLGLVPAVRKAVAALDEGVPLSRIKSQRQQIEQSLAADRLFASLGSALALLAVGLSCIGLYGLMAYNLARRTREIGIRMALGARPARMAWSIIREALWLALAGLMMGVPVALGLMRLIRSNLYGVAPTDPVTLAGAMGVLLVVAIIAAWVPARRAARVDPMTALRCE